MLYFVDKSLTKFSFYHAYTDKYLKRILFCPTKVMLMLCAK